METASMQHQNQSPIMTIGEWLLTLFISAIPLVGFIMLFVWGFGAGTNPTKANYAKATLLLMVIGIVLAIVFFGAIVGLIMSMAGGGGGGEY